MIRVGVVGATGYSGVELLRLLSVHPQVSLTVITSRKAAGQAVGEYFPNLRGVCSLVFSAPEEAPLTECDLVFFATPNGTAMNMVLPLLERGVRVIDLSADFRLADPDEWRRWHGVEHAQPQLLERAVYGLPELNRAALRDARLVANPGCYATAVQLGLLPLLQERVISSEDLIADAKSGVSGAGRKEQLATQLCEASENLKAYAAGGHRHLPEICQGLRAVSGGPVRLTFVPHLIPMIRGIHATLYGRLKTPEADVQAVFEHRYRDEPFVDVLPPGAHPETRSVRGGNLCRVSWHRPGGRDTIVVLSVIDNLGKGAAGQAVQNMNIMFGWDERAGLEQIALLP
ncbi:MAG: N-acetyl-gamma-glutamyl-phosphate reductase [Gammaproteobacteria bacterium]|nr:N-acetyl-gamma-glutamyl-phosphate reductase [Gammaproteobacteria bacterium]NIR83269.1 N-acetyl-gamma-glutamyl-phosphate reductase [Gammaproteobacteria bacterium]NIR91069.1 N-acetyl-gamma-glutamyl-phosphate reductase [Gammaproteobacteria bacterium]NIU04436.1 N-acetyl-gamma-glutamyl-phosphate reductase [Gammaproteobacteria bacterium]NIW87072.1 N-acetyl-gamma-glutamyl-phosphate reductase [Gammaproteobacteria bacterium]